MSLSRFAIPAILSLLAISLGTTASHATTYVGGGGLIEDTTVNTFDINVDDGLLITNFESVSFDGNHTYIQDLIFTITHVNTGHSVTFVNNVPYGVNIDGTYTFVTNLASQTEDADSFWQAAADAQEASNLFETDIPIASGTYAAATYVNPGGGEGGGEGPPPSFPVTDAPGDGYTPTSFDVFNGESTNGIWRLTIDDHVGGDSGTLNSWNFVVSGAVVPEANSLALALPALGMVGGIAFYRRKK